jgi:peroxiredoxin
MPAFKLFRMRLTAKLAFIFFFFVSAALAQGNGSAPRPKEVLKDPDGNVVPNDEFRDYSMSDPQRRDPFTRTVLADGTVELILNRNKFEGSTAPVFSVRTIDGKTIDQAALKGKVLVLNFWFIGCPGCMEEIPKLNRLAAKYAGNRDVVFLALALDTPRALAEFTKKSAFNYLHSGDARETMELFGVRTYPRNVVIGKDGKIAYWRSSVVAWCQFDGVIKAALERK